MESDRLYKAIFSIGGACNIGTAVLVFLMFNALPGILGIEPPRYSIFLYMNLMTLVIFGFMQWTIALHLRESRSLVKLIMWAKFSMPIVFVYVHLVDPPVKELSLFLAPMVAFDFVMGSLFWRFLIYSRSPARERDR